MSLNSSTLNKELIPLFDPLEWELMLKNLDQIVKQKQKTDEQILNNPKLISFIDSIKIALKERHDTMLLKVSNQEQKNKLELEFNQNLTKNVLDKYKQLEELLTNESKKLVQKQNANKLLTDIIDRDENIKKACMKSLYKIYQSFLAYNLLTGLINCLGDNYNECIEVINTLKRINPHTQKEEFVFSYTHNILQDPDTINFLNRINRTFRNPFIIHLYTQIQLKFIRQLIVKQKI